MVVVYGYPKSLLSLPPAEFLSSDLFHDTEISLGKTKVGRTNERGQDQLVLLKGRLWFFLTLLQEDEENGTLSGIVGRCPCRWSGWSSLYFP
jgi:hypothetical protein